MAIGWGILGTGGFAASSIVPGIKGAAGAELRAVGSRDVDRARQFAAGHGIPNAYGSLDDLLADESVQAIWISTANAAHAEQTIRAAAAGKHVLCEKPLALTVADAERMVAAADKSNVRLGTGFDTRHHPLVQSARRRIAAGEIGEPILARGELSNGRGSARGTWKVDPEVAGAGILMGAGVHMMDTLRYLTGREAVAVTGFTDQQLPDRPVDEAIAAIIHFAGACFGVVTNSNRTPHPENSIEVEGSGGRLTIIGAKGNGPAELRLNGQVVETSDLNAAGRLARQVEAFNEAIATGATPNASGLDGLRVVEITVGLQNAVATGQTARLGAGRRDG